MENETLDDRALEGVWLGNDLSTPMFWMYSFKLRKVVRLTGDSTTLNYTGTPAIEHCVCNPGFENLVDGVCHQCTAGKFRTHRVANVENGVSTTCLQCPAHAYCPQVSVEPTLCPADEISAPGSASKSDCKCPAGRGRRNADDGRVCVVYWYSIQ